MAYLSDIINKPVIDLDGNQVGTLKDLVASIPGDMHHPKIMAAAVRQGVKTLLIPYNELMVLLAPAISLARRIQDISTYTLEANDFYLVEDVLDKQIIDTEDMRVVRVNDVELVRANGSVISTNVDVSALGVLRRVGLEGAAQRAAALLRRPIPRTSIAWDYVELLSQERMVRLKVPGDKISDLHPADLADILSDINRDQTGEFIEKLDIEQLADALEEVEPDFQASLVESMSDEKVADILEEMAPDTAADLLAELPEERSEDLLELMEDEDAEDVRKLLAYPEDSAGGLMTTEFAAVRPDMTVEQAICLLRQEAGMLETIYYIYVVDEGNHLIGVFSVSDLILNQPDILVSEFMHKRVVYGELTDSQEKIARLVAKYNLIAVPVVDEDHILQGIVTADDALDRIIPTAWKKRLPHFFH